MQQNLKYFQCLSHLVIFQVLRKRPPAIDMVNAATNDENACCLRPRQASRKMTVMRDSNIFLDLGCAG